MTLPLILLFVASACLLTLLRLRRSARVLWVLAVLLTLGICCGPVPALLLNDLEVGNPDEGPQSWQPRSVIIVLGGGIQQIPRTGALHVPPIINSRIVKGLELYLRCKRAGGACVLLISGGVTEVGRPPEAQVYAAVFAKLGVDPADLALEGNSVNTWQNAQFCAAWLQAHSQDQVVLVTSGVHVRRSLVYFAHFGIRAQGVRSDYIGTPLKPIPDSSYLFITDLALHEYAGLARYHLYNLLGWNIAAQRPGAL